MHTEHATEIDVIDQLNARLKVLEAQAIAFQDDDGADALRRLSPETLGRIFWGVQLAAADCQALVRQLDQARLGRAGAPPKIATDTRAQH
jgi:plasmid replication initiation protein